ncbi:thermonuclease family protein [Curvivirga sp.]|uniref:thermonuclease family protein n=1 Tax=Curvivirga sp. TaxID=2856848 RepID=UPI003B5CF506
MSVLQKQVKVGFLLLFSFFASDYAAFAEENSAPVFTDEITGMQNFPVLRGKSGHTIVLSGIERPQSHGLSGYRLNKARLWLSNHAVGKKLVIQPTGDQYDLFGRVHALTKEPNQNWLNVQLLDLGLARVQLNTGFTDHIDILYKAEKEARLQKTGLWGTGKFESYDANQYNGPYKGFIIATGIITQAAKRRSYLYLNFGSNWQDDFTIGIPTNDERFDTKTIQNLYVEGTKVEIRGLIESWNGPFIRLDVAEHLRVIQD